MEDDKVYSYSIIEYNGNKYFKKELKLVDDEHIQMLNNELHKWNLLKKYSFIPKICFFDNEKKHYIMYEYIEGKNLCDYKFSSLKEKIDVLATIANRLYTIHQLFLVHGDLKPENIMITEDKDVYIIDFACSKYIGEKISYGSKRYCSIEQLNKEKARTNFDIYALGVIMYELLTNKKAFLGMNDNELYDFKKSDKYLVIDEDASIPLEVERVFFKIVNNKYANMNEIEKELLSCNFLDYNKNKV